MIFTFIHQKGFINRMGQGGRGFITHLASSKLWSIY